MAGSDPKSTPDSLSGIALAVTGLASSLAALTLTGTLGRVQRDDPLWISLAFGLVIFGGGVWALAPLSSERSSRLLRTLSVLTVAAGFVIAVVAAVDTANDDPRPHISAHLSSDRKTLVSTISIENLSSDHRVALAVLLLNSSEEKFPLYRGFVGPTSEGGFDETLRVPLPNLEPFTVIEVRAYTGAESQSCDETAGSEESPPLNAGTACALIWTKLEGEPITYGAAPSQ